MLGFVITGEPGRVGGLGAQQVRPFGQRQRDRRLAADAADRLGVAGAGDGPVVLHGDHARRGIEGGDLIGELRRRRRATIATESGCPVAGNGRDDPGGGVPLPNHVAAAV